MVQLLHLSQSMDIPTEGSRVTDIPGGECQEIYLENDSLLKYLSQMCENMNILFLHEDAPAFPPY